MKAISGACEGVVCAMCASEHQICKEVTGRDLYNPIPLAGHKVGEEFLYDDPRHPSVIEAPCHNVTQYICCTHFNNIFGLDHCGHDEPRVSVRIIWND